jgi:hypothetical protein
MSDESAHRAQEYRKIEFPEEGYNAYRWKVGGKEPDGKPTRIGKWTFATKMVRDVVLDHVGGRVLNACAGETKLSNYKRGCEFVRNDLDESIPADSHVDVREIHHEYGDGSFDAAVLDPPFDPGRAAKLYEGWHGSEYSSARDAVGQLVKPGGTVVELGWNSYGLGDKDGWERQAWYIYPQASFKGDVHLTVDRRINQQTLVATNATEEVSD